MNELNIDALDALPFCDTHCHLYVEEFHKDLDDVMDRAAKANVREIFLPAINLESMTAMKLLGHDQLRFYPMAGLHPCEIKGDVTTLLDRIEDWVDRDDIVAVGETGLDYYWSKDQVEAQKTSLRRHCGWSRESGKPIVLHNRDSTTDLLDLIEEEQDGRLTGVWHCFTGTAEEAARAMDLGLYLGVGGVSTFKNAGVGEVVAELPLERLLLETDAPWLSPAPHRGERNEPSRIVDIARHLARHKDIDLQEVANRTTRNAWRLFTLDPEDLQP
ncbi:MAG: TatD family hydrolase [Bacteroidota bacterium]